MSTSSEKGFAISQACASIVLRNHADEQEVQAVSISAAESALYIAGDVPFPVPHPNRCKPQYSGETEAARRARIAEMTPTDEDLAAAANPPPPEWYKEKW